MTLKLNKLLEPSHVTTCYSNVTFNPERHAETYLQRCEQMLANIQSTVEKLPEQAEKIDAELPLNWQKLATIKAQYCLDKWIKLLNAEVSAMIKCASSAITGRSGFNVARAEKARSAQNAKAKKREEFEGMIGRIILQSVFSHYDLSVSIRSDDPRALEKLHAKMEFLKDKLERQKLQNKIVRKYGATEKCIQELVKAGLDAPIEVLKQKSAMWWMKYTSNTRAKIKQVQQRISQITQKSKMESKSFDKGSYIIFQDVESDRIGFRFKEKPNSEIVSALKKHAFKWSPKNGVWQRQWTNAGLHALNQIRKILGEEGA